MSYLQVQGQTSVREGVLRGMWIVESRTLKRCILRN